MRVECKPSPEEPDDKKETKERVVTETADEKGIGKNEKKEGGVWSTVKRKKNSLLKRKKI